MASNVLQFPRRAANDDNAPLPPAGPFAARRLLHEFLTEITGEEDPINGALWSDRSWQPSMEKKDVGTFYRKVTADEDRQVRCLCMLASLDVPGMRAFVQECDIAECLEVLRAIWSYSERLEEIRSIGQTMVSRLFALSLEVHGGGVDPLVRRVA